eukprot:TRINITY_DN1367_c0_g1_i1.p1 TRINITY_DN1367_c0_g1~~TRINITY_DN1367_c0_g1_i1.p1  ORF type:complete len:304 (+),score=41.32 TRINITY_DN1367_c0_g1_i1:903-1814(+)
MTSLALTLTPATVLAHGHVVPHSPFVSGPPLPTLARLYPPGFRSRLVLPAGEAYVVHIEDLGDRPVFVVTSEHSPHQSYRELELGAALRVPLERAGLPVSQDFEWLSGLKSIQSELLDQLQACLMTHLRTNDTQLRRGKRRKVKEKHEKQETLKLAQGPPRALSRVPPPIPTERADVNVDDIPIPNFDVDSEEEERRQRRQRKKRARQTQTSSASLLSVSPSSSSSSHSAPLSSAGSGELGQSASAPAPPLNQQPRLKRRRIAPATLPMPPVPMRTTMAIVTPQNPLVNLVLLGRFFNMARPG